jgi:hypothetical protein
MGSVDAMSHKAPEGATQFLCINSRSGIMSPLRGSTRYPIIYQELAPLATRCRSSGARTPLTSLQWDEARKHPSPQGTMGL